MGWACGMHMREEMHTDFWGGEVEEKRPLVIPRRGWNNDIKWTLKKKDGTVWTVSG